MQLICPPTLPGIPKLLEFWLKFHFWHSCRWFALSISPVAKYVTGWQLHSSWTLNRSPDYPLSVAVRVALGQPTNRRVTTMARQSLCRSVTHEYFHRLPSNGMANRWYPITCFRGPRIRRDFHLFKYTIQQWLQLLQKHPKSLCQAHQIIPVSKQRVHVIIQQLATLIHSTTRIIRLIVMEQ